MEISALASGSSGNCFYVADKDTAILIDAGISAKQTLQRLQSINENPAKIRGIFITHEHIDHVRGADVLARKLNIPIFATKSTIHAISLCSNKELIKCIKSNVVIKIRGLKIEAFSKDHSAVDPVSYNIHENKKISIITDAGHACGNIQKNVSNCDFLCIEANHDEQMLENGPYPNFLKKWISSDKGHLSNEQAALCILEYASSRLNRIILSHLSQTNNTPEIALKTFTEIIKQRKDITPEITVSLRESPTALFKI